MLRIGKKLCFIAGMLAVMLTAGNAFALKPGDTNTVDDRLEKSLKHIEEIEATNKKIMDSFDAMEKEIKTAKIWARRS